MVQTYNIACSIFQLKQRFHDLLTPHVHQKKGLDIWVKSKLVW